MPRRLRPSHLLCCAPLLVSSVHALAAQITIDQSRCGERIHLVVKHALLSDVLKQLSQKLDFELQFESAIDPIIDIDTSQPAPELVAKLSPGDNMLITQALDRECPRRYRIVKVWVLPKSKGSIAATTPAAKSATSSAPARSSATPPIKQWTPAELDAMSRQRKAAYDAYVKEHGEPPPPAED